MNIVISECLSTGNESEVVYLVLRQQEILDLRPIAREALRLRSMATEDFTNFHVRKKIGMIYEHLPESMRERVWEETDALFPEGSVLGLRETWPDYPDLQISFFVSGTTVLGKPRIKYSLQYLFEVSGESYYKELDRSGAPDLLDLWQSAQVQGQRNQR